MVALVARGGVASLRHPTSATSAQEATRTRGGSERSGNLTPSLRAPAGRVSLPRVRYFFFAEGFAAAPPPNGFGGSATPRRPEAELPAAFAFVPFAGFIGAAGGSGGVGAAAAMTGGGSGCGSTTALAADEGSDGVEAAALAAALAFEVFGPSSDAPTMIKAAVPTTTHTPTSTRQMRSAMLGFGATWNEADASEGIERWLGSASGA